MAIEITDENFNSEVQSFSGVVLVDCFAEWCGPCKILKPLLADIAEENDVKIGFLDIDDNPATTKQLSVTSIPKVVVFKNGEQVHEMLGVCSKENYQSIIDDLS